MAYGRESDYARMVINEALIVAFGILFVGIILNLMFNFSYNSNSDKTFIDKHTLSNIQEFLDLIDILLDLIIFILSLIVTIEVIENKLDDISPLLAIVVLISAPYMPSLKELLSFVHPDGKLMAAVGGTTMGFILYFIRRLMQSKLKEPQL